MERTDEVSGNGNSYDFKFRGYDPRLGKFWAVDPLVASYPWNTPYGFAENSPILGIDLEGKEFVNSNTVINSNTGQSFGQWVALNNINLTSVEKDGENFFRVHSDLYLTQEGLISFAEGDGKTQITEWITATINVDRFAEGSTSTIARLSSPEYEEVDGYILEPGGPSTTVANKDKRIPAGEYDVVEHSGDTFKNVPKLFNDQVPQSRAILQHPGNTGKNTEGCLLPGCDYTNNGGEYQVTSSGKKAAELVKLYNKIGYANVNYVITDIAAPEEVNLEGVPYAEGQTPNVPFDSE